MSVILLNAKVVDGIMPFFAPVVFGFVATNKKWHNFCFGAVVALVIENFYLFGTIKVINFLIVFVSLIIIVSKRNSKVNFLIIASCILTSNVVDIVFFSGVLNDFIFIIANLLIQVVLGYFYWRFFVALKNRSQPKFVVDELFGLVFLILPIVMVIYNFEVQNFLIGKGLVFALLVLVGTIFETKEAVGFSIISGVGVSISNSNLNYLAVMLVWMIGILFAKRFGRIASILFASVLDFLIQICFNVYPNYSLNSFLPLICCSVLVFFVSSSTVKYFKDQIYSSVEKITENTVFLLEETKMKQKINELSKLFFSIHSAYGNMVIGKVNPKQIKQVLKRDVERNYCIGCIKYPECYSEKKLASKAIDVLISCGVEKKRVNVLDTPQFLSSNCGKITDIMDSINARLEKVGGYEREIKREDDSKLTISHQLLGVSDILKNFSSEISLGDREDRSTEREIVETFLFNNIIVGDCAVFFKDSVFNKAIFVIKNEGYKEKEIVDILTSYFKVPIAIETNVYAKNSGWQIVLANRCAKYQYRFGVSQVQKQKISGDCCLKRNLDGKTVLFSVCDGKGTGVVANNLSNTALSLVENFYRVGFDSELIASNVNAILSYKSGENFSAVDICVLNLEDGSVDFIKRGGTPSVIKKSNGTKVIESKDLPLGVIEKFQGKTEKHYLDSGDVVVVASDGVFDAFNGSDEFAGFINNLPANNMNLFAKQIIKKAFELNDNKILDDMTVLAFKIFES